MNDSSFRWAPKVPRDNVRRVYASDARGQLDVPMVNAVGLALLMRCQSIVMLADGRVHCARCRRWVMPLDGPDEMLSCTGGCGHATSIWSFREEVGRHEVDERAAGPMVRQFVERYPRLTTPPERLVLTDRLLHSFLGDLRTELPGRPLVHHLVDVSPRSALVFLDTLAYGQGTHRELLVTRAMWWRALAQRHRPPVTAAR